LVFAARILRLDEYPLVERNREQDEIDPSGMKFAVGGAGIVEGMHEAPKLGTQVDKFWRLVRHDIIDKDLTDSVALIAFSSKHGFARVNEMTSSKINAMAQDLTDKIADTVEQLMDLDVEKVMVSTLPPIGCTPWLSRSSDYSTCDSQTLFKDETVFNLD
jgi:hypothetical protein